MSNIQLYWDGSSGVCTYGTRKTFFKKKPTITSLSFDSVTYSEDENLKLKTLNGKTLTLTDNEIASIKLFCDATATEEVTETQTVEAHNADTTAHHDLRVLISDLTKYAHKVATVWSAEDTFTSAIEKAIEWDYIINDLNDCSDTVDHTYWVCPHSESFDIRVLLGLEGVDTTADIPVTVKLKKNGVVIATGTTTISKDTKDIPTLELVADGIILSYRDKLSVTVTGLASGSLIPSRTLLIVDNHGSTLAKRQAEYVYNTLGNHVYYKGVDMYLKQDSKGAQIVASTWNPDFTVLTLT